MGQELSRIEKSVGDLVIGDRPCHDDKKKKHCRRPKRCRKVKKHCDRSDSSDSDSSDDECEPKRERKCERKSRHCHKHRSCGQIRSGFDIVEGRDRPPYLNWQLSRRVDLTKANEIAGVPVFDGRCLNTADADAVCFLYQYAALTQKRAFEDVSKDIIADPSRLFVNYNGKLVGHGCANLESCLLGINQYGVTSAALWPYVKHNVDHCPSDLSYEKARFDGSRKILFEKIAFNDPDKVRQVMGSINNTQPLAARFAVYHSFEKSIKCNPLAIACMPSEHERKCKPEHSVTLVLCGYDVATGTFLARGNNGPCWGDKGYCRIPFAYVADECLCGDLWCVSSNSLDKVAQNSREIECVPPAEIPRWVDSVESVDQLK